MKRALVLLLALALLAAPAFAADKVELIWTAQATNTSKSVQTAGYGEAQITVWAATHVYLCSATDTWVRAALATWP